MSVFRFLRPKYKHPDPAVRAAAVANLADQALLAKIVLHDENPDVQQAALARLADPDLRAAVARSACPQNAAALEGIDNPALLAAIAQHAESAAVRTQAAARVVDVGILHKIAAHDIDPDVRRRARSRLRDGNCLQQYLRRVLSALEPAPSTPTEVGFSGALDEICAAVTSDARFQIDAVMTELPATELPAADCTWTTLPRPAAGRSWVDLIAHRRGSPGTTGRNGVHYQIRICRRGENAYHWWVKERRAELVNDVQSWASSSQG